MLRIRDQTLRKRFRRKIKISLRFNLVCAILHVGFAKQLSTSEKERASSQHGTNSWHYLTSEKGEVLVVTRDGVSVPILYVN